MYNNNYACISFSQNNGYAQEIETPPDPDWKKVAAVAVVVVAAAAVVGYALLRKQKSYKKQRWFQYAMTRIYLQTLDYEYVQQTTKTQLPHSNNY